jgi:hypothetical protein
MTRHIHPPNHPWRLPGIEVFGAEAVLKVFKYNPTPTIAQLVSAGCGEANFNTAIAQLLREEKIEVYSKHPTRYRLKAK